VNLFKNEIKFLGHVISNNKLMTDPEKIEAIMNWKVPVNVKQLQSFLGITNYYRKFIQSYSEIAVPLTKLLKDDEKYIWTAAQQTAFEVLKNELVKKPILLLPDMNLRFSVTTDASKYAIGAVLQQDQGKGIQPVAYISKKLNETEQRYPTHEQELYALVFALKKWRHYLLNQPFDIYTDN